MCDSQQANQAPDEHRTHGLCELCMAAGAGSEGNGGSHNEEEVVKRSSSCQEGARSVPGSLSVGGQRGAVKGPGGHMAFKFVEYRSAGGVDCAGR